MIFKALPMKTFRLAALMVCLFTVIGFAQAAPVPGEPAPMLIVPQLDGKAFNLAALSGKVVIINFWATWCPPCREEMPALDAFSTRFHSSGVEMIGLSVDRGRDRESVVKDAQTVHYPVAMLADAETNGFGKPVALPITFIVDRVGIVQAVLTPETSALTEDGLAQVVMPLLRKD